MGDYFKGREFVLPISVEELEARRVSVGASDVAAIMGLSPFANAHDIYLQKVVGTDHGGGTEAQNLGNDCEPMLVIWADEQLGNRNPDSLVEVDKKFTKLVEEPDGRVLPAHANLDGFSIYGDQRVGIEAKTTSMYGVFGEQGTDEVPDHILVQAQWQIFVADLQRVVIPVLHGDGNLRRSFYIVHKNEEIFEGAKAKVLSFWNDHVIPKVPPTEVLPSLETMTNLRRQPDSTVEVSEDLVRSWLVTKELKAQATKDERDAKAALMAALSDAEGGTCSLGELSYLKQKRASYTTNDTEFRVLRWKGNKK